MSDTPKSTVSAEDHALVVDMMRAHERAAIELQRECDALKAQLATIERDTLERAAFVVQGYESIDGPTAASLIAAMASPAPTQSAPRAESESDLGA
ncbi:MAG: hypothetical protein KGL39_03890 [Patescibacteria group bacterium]|nr:hypothetical protein [Patescibacteria group bacterium]